MREKYKITMNYGKKKAEIIEVKRKILAKEDAPNADKVNDTEKNNFKVKK